jgi:hypothetical protein
MVATTLDAQLIQRVRGEFLEMPGLRLTFQQARRLWGLDEDTCACVLHTLVISGFLVREDDEQYARAFDGEPLTVWIDETGSGSGQRQPQRNDRSAFLRGLDGNPAMMRFDQPLHGRESEAGAARFRRHER